MKGIRKLALAGLAIAAASLVLAAAPAAAETALCASSALEEDAICGKGAGKEESSASFVLTSTNPTLTTNIANVSCEDSAMTVKPSAATGGGAIAAEVTALNFTGNCKTAGGTGCTVTVLNLPYPAAIESSGEGKSAFAVEDLSGAGFTVKCGTQINCTFTSTSANFSGFNGSVAFFAISNLGLSRSGSVCPTTSSFDAIYRAAEPAGFTVGPIPAGPTEVNTALCATGTPESALCGEGAGKKLSSEAIALTSTNPVLTTNVATVTCEDSAMTVEPGAATSEGAIAAEVTALTFSGNCKTNGGTACTFTVLNLPYPAAVESSGEGKSTLAVEDETGAGFTVKCGFLIICTFTTTEATFNGTNGSPTTFVASSLGLTRSGGFCPETSSFDATYAVSEPAGFTVGPIPAPAEVNTALCATGTPESALCGEGAGKKPNGASILLTSTNPLLTTNSANVSCEDSAMTVKPSVATSEGAIAAEVTALTFSGNCKTNGGTACTFTIVNLPYPAAIESSGEGKSTLAVEDETGAGFTVKCGFLINCTFTTKAATFNGTNGSPTTFAASSLALTRSGGFCPETSSFDATYAATEPSGFTVGPIAEPNTALCATGSPESALCGEGAGKKPTSAAIALTSTNPVLTTNVATVTCEDSAMTVEPSVATSEGAIAAEVTALSFTGNCKTNGGTACTFTIVNLPYLATIESGEGESPFTIEDETGAGFTVKCGFLINCTFATKAAELGVTNGSPTTFEASSIGLTRSGSLCPETSAFDATYSVSEPAGFTVL